MRSMRLLLPEHIFRNFSYFMILSLYWLGDAYLCATNLLEEDANNINVARDAAIRALAMAKVSATCFFCHL